MRRLAVMAALALYPGHCLAQKSASTAEGLPVYPPSDAPITVAEVFDHLEAFEKKMTSLTANFSQSVKMEESGGLQTISGTVEYQKPNRLRVEHVKPERQTVVCDGKSLWVWRRETNQVIETSLEDWKKSEPLAEGLLDFGDYSALLKRYDVSIDTVSAADRQGYRSISLLLRPKDGKEDFRLKLGLTTRDYFPADAELRAGQVRIQSHFDKIRLNPELAAGRFQFTPPAGSDIFTNFKPPRAR